MSSLYKKGESLVANIHYTITCRIKYLKRFFTGEGKMMKLYTMIYSLKTANDTDGLLYLKDTLESTMPPFHSAQYTKQVELLLYIDYLLKAPKMSYKLRVHKQFELMKSIDTTHEIGRKIVSSL